MPVQPNFILDNQGITLRQIGGMVVFDLLDASQNVLGQPEIISASSVSMNTASTTIRSIGGVQVTNNTMANIDPLNYMLRPSLVLGDGTRWPLGVFVFSNRTDDVEDGVYPVELSLSDQSAFLNVDSVYGYSIQTGTSIVGTINAIIDALRIGARTLPNDTATVGNSQTWAPGATWLKILTDLCALGGYYPPYFDNEGVFTVRRPVDPFNADADLVYVSNQGKVINKTLKTNAGIFSAPNAYYVIDTAPKAAPISAVAYVEPGLPWSKENRGGRIFPVVIQQQGLDSLASAQTMANAAAASAPQGFSTINFSSIPDPRHDVFQIIEWDGVLYREVSWSMPLKYGEPMTHQLAQGGFPNAG